MKYLLMLLLALGIAGCTTKHQHQHQPKFTIGEIVHVKQGFYKDCIGMVTGYSRYKYIPSTYVLRDVSCPNMALNYILIDVAEVE